MVSSRRFVGLVQVEPSQSRSLAWLPFSVLKLPNLFWYYRMKWHRLQYSVVIFQLLGSGLQEGCFEREDAQPYFLKIPHTHDACFAYSIIWLLHVRNLWTLLIPVGGRTAERKTGESRAPLYSRRLIWANTQVYCWNIVGPVTQL